jgi:hypothetical protein
MIWRLHGHWHRHCRKSDKVAVMLNLFQHPPYCGKACSVGVLDAETSSA